MSVTFLSFNRFTNLDEMKDEDSWSPEGRYRLLFISEKYPPDSHKRILGTIRLPVP